VDDRGGQRSGSAGNRSETLNPDDNRKWWKGNHYRPFELSVTAGVGLDETRLGRVV